jgi:DNA primase
MDMRSRVKVADETRREVLNHGKNRLPYLLQSEFGCEVENSRSWSGTTPCSCPLPEHGGDTHPSAAIYASELNPDGVESFWCFKCERRLTAHGIVKHVKNLNDGEAWNFLSKRAGVDGKSISILTVQAKSDQKLNSLKLKFLRLCAEALRDAGNSECAAALDEIRDWDFGDEFIDKQLIGYCPLDGSIEKQLAAPDENGIYRWTSQDLRRAGILRKDQDGNYIGRYAGRITIPDIGEDGTVRGIDGRAAGILPSDADKYDTLPGQKIPIGVDCVAGKEVKECIIVEGSKDRLAILQAGYRDVIALRGKALKKEWAGLFKGVRTVYVCMDGDAEGRKAAVKIARQLHNVLIISLPDEEDPHSFSITHGAEWIVEFRKLKQQAVPLIRCLINLIPSRDSVPEDIYDKAVNEVLDLLSTFSASKREDYLADLASELGWHSDKKRAVRTELNQRAKKLERSVHKQTNAAMFTGEERNTDGHDDRYNLLQEYGTIVACGKNIVDIVEEEPDKPGLLMLIDEEESYDAEGLMKEIRDVNVLFTSCYRKDGRVYTHPSLNNMPWGRSPDDALDEREYIPFPSLPRILEHVETDTPEKIFDDLEATFRKYAELPDEMWYKFLAAYVILSYAAEWCAIIPFVLLPGRPGLGKSRVAMVIIYTSYRGIPPEAITPATMFRLASYYSPTLYIEVTDINKEIEKSPDFENLLLSRYEGRASSIPRVKDKCDKPFEDLRFYHSSARNTIISSNKSGYGPFLSRCYVIQMRQASKKFPDKIEPFALHDLRNRLVALRLRMMIQEKKTGGCPLPDVTPPFLGRPGDKARPILRIMKLVKPSEYDIMLEFLRKVERIQLDEKSFQLDARIVKAIWDMAEAGGVEKAEEDEGLFKNERAEKGPIRKSTIDEKLILDELNVEAEDDDKKITPQRVGVRLHAMGFEVCKSPGGKGKAVIYNREQVIREMAMQGVIPEEEIDELLNPPESNTGDEDDNEGPRAD